MTARRWAIFLVVCFAVFIALEAWGLASGMTLSQTVWAATDVWPPLPFVLGLAIGLVAGHFWWSRKTSVRTTERAPFVIPDDR